MRCPWCDSIDIDVPTVDIGVGEQQCGAAGCMDCSSFQINPNEPLDPDLTDEEIKLGWRRGPDVDASIAHRKRHGTIQLDQQSVQSTNATADPDTFTYTHPDASGS